VSGGAPFYNFGQNGQALHRQPQGEKQMAIFSLSAAPEMLRRVRIVNR